MADRSSRWSHSLGQTVGRLRKRGRDTLMAALAPAPIESPRSLPTLQGEPLAKHHLSLALNALRDTGLSKTDSFRKLRLLVNAVEQSRLATSTLPPAPTAAPEPPLSRRERLLSRAFESAQILGWRSERDERAARA